MNIAICDDEEIFRRILRDKISEYSHDIKLTEFSSGNELVRSRCRFDVIFLDIDMPGIDGMETAAKIRKDNVDALMIFLTSHEEFVREAFKVRAFRFLPKPVNDSELFEALREAEKELSCEDKLVIEQKGRIYEIKLNDIVYMEAYGDGTYIYDCGGNVYDSKKTLKKLESELGGKPFFKIHKSFMVSLRYVLSFEGSSLVLKTVGTPLTVSRRNITAFREAYLDYVRKNARPL